MLFLPYILWGSLVIDMQHFEHYIACYKSVMFQHQMVKKVSLSELLVYIDLKTKFFQKLKS